MLKEPPTISSLDELVQAASNILKTPSTLKQKEEAEHLFEYLQTIPFP